jgi:hypothetical protein
MYYNRYCPLLQYTHYYSMNPKRISSSTKSKRKNDETEDERKAKAA